MKKKYIFPEVSVKLDRSNNSIYSREEATKVVQKLELKFDTEMKYFNDDFDQHKRRVLQKMDERLTVITK